MVAGLVSATALAGSGRAAAVPRAGRAATAGVISTVAGGVGGPAKATNVGLDVCGVSYADGHVELADGGAVRTVNPRTDWLTTPAGTGHFGPAEVGRLATRASVTTCGVTTDHQGNLVIADSDHELIRVVAHQTGTFYRRHMVARHIYTIAGDGKGGFNGDGIPATAAELRDPEGVAVDAAGNVLFSDSINNRIRMVAAATGTFYGQAMTAGYIYTIAGGGHTRANGVSATQARIAYPHGVVLDRAGNVLIADTVVNRIKVVAEGTGTFYGQAMIAGDIYTIAGDSYHRGFSGDGGPATKAKLTGSSGVATDAAGNVLIADTGNNRIRVVAASSGTFYGQAMTAGDIYLIAGDGTAGFAGDGGPATAAELSVPPAVATDGAGNVLIATSSRLRVVAVATGTFYGQAMIAGDIYTVAGNGTELSGGGRPATAAQLNRPNDVAIDGAGNLLIADSSNDRIRVVAAATGTFYQRAMHAGDIYSIVGGGTSLASGVPATTARLDSPGAAMVDGAGNVLIADTVNNRLRVVAAATGTFYGQAMTAGDIYTVAGTGQQGFSGDGGPATAAKLHYPQNVAIDAAGNLLIADSGNDRIRVVAASSGTFYGQAMTAGDIYSIAGDGTSGFSGDGGPATAAEFAYPQDVAIDAAGNVLIADSGNQRIRVVAASSGTFYGQTMTAGDVYTIAGDATEGFSGNGGPATAASLADPQDVAIDAAGNVLIADARNQRIRVVAASSGTFYGQVMTAGDIYSIAGDGADAIDGEFGGDGGPATAAELAFPAGMAIDAAGNVLFADSSNARIREISG
jgi:sugar lactone lactonase YvrE